MSILAGKVVWLIVLVVLCVGLVVGAVFTSMSKDADAAKRPQLKTLWAVVDADGTLIRGKGVTGHEKIDAGRYEIDFNRDISQCAYTVTLSMGASGQPTTQEGFGGPRSTDVIIGNSAGTANEDNPFHLVVNC